MANTATCKPFNVGTSLTRVTGGQSIVDKAQKHNIFVKVLSRCVWIVAFDQTSIKTSTSLSQVQLNAAIFNPLPANFNYCAFDGRTKLSILIWLCHASVCVWRFCVLERIGKLRQGWNLLNKVGNTSLWTEKGRIQGWNTWRQHGICSRGRASS